MQSPLDAYTWICRRYTGIQSAGLDEVSPGVWEGGINTSMGLIDLDSDIDLDGVSLTSSGSTMVSIFLLGTSADAKNALKQIQEIAGAGVVVKNIARKGWILKGMSIKL